MNKIEQFETWDARCELLGDIVGVVTGDKYYSVSPLMQGDDVITVKAGRFKLGSCVSSDMLNRLKKVCEEYNLKYSLWCESIGDDSRHEIYCLVSFKSLPLPKAKK